MQFSKNWLHEWINPKLTTAQLGDILTMAGLEVDSIHKLSKFEQVFVARIQKVEAHPQSDTLSVCQLELGGDKTVQVITAADNVEEGQRVAFAEVGAYLPSLHKDTQRLEVAEFKGLTSDGMLLSFAELGIAESSDEIIVFSGSAPVGDLVWDYLHLDDEIIEIDLTPNRGDCLSIQGVAREVHALTKANYNPIKIDPIAALNDETLEITLEASDACSRYCSRVIKNVDCTKKTPDWMVEKLRSFNIRTINPVVDVMNYIMIELGQPMHAFDLDKISGEIVVRYSQSGEALKLLDGQEVTCDDSTLLIADATKPLAIAGIMGGDESSVCEETTSILLESAFFNPIKIAGKGRYYGLHSDSAHRFERGVDPSGQSEAIERATQWILDICGGEPGPVMDVTSSHDSNKKPVSLSIERANRLLGFETDKKAISQDFERLECQVESHEDELIITPPSFRFDLNIEEDLIEEIARLKGYDNIELKLPRGLIKPQRMEAYPDMRLKQVLVDEGYQEAITYSFVSSKLQKQISGNDDHIGLSNPIASDLDVMRKSLWPGLLKSVGYNAHRQQSDFCLFEVGLVFNEYEGELHQEKMIGGVACGAITPEHWDGKIKPLDFYEVKGHVERLFLTTGKSLESITWQPTENQALHPGKSANILYQGQAIGVMGAIHPSLEKELDLPGPIFLFQLKCEPLLKIDVPAFTKPSIFPAVRRDLSFVVGNEKSCQEITHWLRSCGGKTLKDIVVFDLYQGKGVPEGHKSMAMGLIWQDAMRTMVDKDIDSQVSVMIKGLQDTFGAQLRD